MLHILLVLIFCILGVLVGVLTGILPGLHVNNIALILLSFSGAIISLCAPLFSYGFTEEFILLLIAVFITGVAISHTFHDVLPTTFLGAPDEDTALTILPAHNLLLQGRGYEAISWSAMGSFGAILVCFVLVYPVRWIIGYPLQLYAVLQEVMGWVLLAIALFMLATEKGMITDFGASGRRPAVMGILFAVFVFLLSGFFGLVILSFPVSSPFGLSAPVLFPALTGLFGMPTLVNSLVTQPVIPKQKIERLQLSGGDKKESVLSVVTGSIAGVLVSIIPGITSATGTIMAMNARQKSGNEQTIVTLSAVNTASAFAVVAVLFIILRPRSGAALAVNELVAVEEWTGWLIPQYLVFLLIALLVGGCLSYVLTIKLGGLFARYFVRVPYEKLVGGTILLIVCLVLVFTGVLGLLVVVVATCIGFLPILWGVRRSHCMGVLLVPIILHFLL